MAIFEVEIGGKTYEVDAPDQGSAVSAVRGMAGAPSRADVSSRDPSMGSDGMSGDALRSMRAGDTRAQMRPQDISAAYDVAAQRGDRPEAQAMARAYAARERADSPMMMGVSDRFRTAARGVPFIGEWLDEANAYTAHPLDKAARQKRLDYERARDTTFDQANPYQSMGLKAAGGIAGTMAALPLAGGAAGGAMFGAGASTVPGAIARGVAAGGLQGAASGAGRAENQSQIVQNVMRDGGFGMVVGGTIPALLGAGGIAVDKIRNTAQSSDALSKVAPQAREYLTKQLSPQALVEAEKKLAQVGPNAVLADVSPEFQAMAGAAAAKPGMRDPIVTALEARNAAKNMRLQSAADDALGPVVEPSAIKAAINEGKDTLGPQYGETIAKNGVAVPTKGLADKLDAQVVDLKGSAQKAVENVRSMLNIRGTKELDPNPNALFQTRQAIDGLLANESNPKVIQTLTEIRKEVDGILGQSVPGIKQIDAKWQELARQGEGLEKGATAFRSGPTATRPADFKQAMQEAPNPQGMMIGPSAEPFRIRQGARAELDRIMGTQANDVAALRNALKGEGDWNRAKMGDIFGQPKSDKFLSALDAETAMENTYRNVVGNSQTAPRLGFKEYIDGIGKSEGIVKPESTLWGTAITGGKKLMDKISGANREEAQNAVVKALGELSMSDAPRARQILADLQKRVAAKNGTEKFNELIGRMGVGGARIDDANSAKAAIMAALLGREYLKGAFASPPSK